MIVTCWPVIFSVIVVLPPKFRIYAILSAQSFDFKIPYRGKWVARCMISFDESKLLPLGWLFDVISHILIFFHWLSRWKTSQIMMALQFLSNLFPKFCPPPLCSRTIILLVQLDGEIPLFKKLLKKLTKANGYSRYPHKRSLFYKNLEARIQLLEQFKQKPHRGWNL